MCVLLSKFVGGKGGRLYGEIGFGAGCVGRRALGSLSRIKLTDAACFPLTQSQALC